MPNTSRLRGRDHTRRVHKPSKVERAAIISQVVGTNPKHVSRDPAKDATALKIITTLGHPSITVKAVFYEMRGW